jgi:hypothetical protein
MKTFVCCVAESVFCCDLLEKGGKIFAVSGGEDDKAYLWDVATGQVSEAQGCQIFIFLTCIPKWENIYQITTKYTK